MQRMFVCGYDARDGVIRCKLWSLMSEEMNILKQSGRDLKLEVLNIFNQIMRA